jgi:metal-responsive CopG/Arc/MetJ family transcriptional regulator
MTMTDKMVRLDVWIQEWLMRRIDQVAKEMGVKRSVAVRLLLMAGLGDWNFEKWQQRKKEVMKDGMDQDQKQTN